MGGAPRPWREAWQESVYGPGGWAHQPAGPAGHFRTSVHVPLFAEAVTSLLARVDAALGHPDPLHLVDVGAGRGELLLGVLDAVPAATLTRLRPIAVELTARPDGLDDRIEWRAALPEADSFTGLLIGNEWLDDVPLDVVEGDAAGRPYVVQVTSDGAESSGGEPAAEEAAWLAAWWPITGPGARAEIGWPRDAAWRAAVASVARGAAVAIDYAHTREARPAYGSLSGFREGRQVPPAPDGGTNLTAHVAVDAVAAATADLVTTTMTLTQRQAIEALGLTADRPDPSLAAHDPAGYLRALQRRGELAELRDADGLGGFTWLLQTRAIDAVL